MSRSSVLAATEEMVHIVENPVIHEAWSNLKALMRFGPTFDHVSNLLPPTLLTQQLGSYSFKFKLNISEADELGRGREFLKIGNDRNKVHYNSKVLVRCFNVKSVGELHIDCFPPNSYVRVNDVNYKYGGEGPIDVTRNIKMCPNVENVVTIDVSVPTGFYVVTIILVRALSPSAIVRRLCETRLSSPEITKAKIRSFHESGSNDLAVTSTKFSLVCPLAQKRFDVPAKGQKCTHLTCFDLLTYLKLNGRTNRWLCPICNTKVLPAQLVVDGYWKEIVDTFIKESNPSSSLMLTDEGTWDCPFPVKSESDFLEL